MTFIIIVSFLKSNDPAMKSSQAVTKLLPLMIGYFSLSVPSGLSLYWWGAASSFVYFGGYSFNFPLCFSISLLKCDFAGWPITFWAQHSKYGFKNMVVPKIQWRSSLIWSRRKTKLKKLTSLSHNRQFRSLFQNWKYQERRMVKKWPRKGPNLAKGVTK